jgi:cytochrome c oxidase subunit 2
VGSALVRRLLRTTAGALLAVAAGGPAALAQENVPPESLLQPAGPQAGELYRALMFDLDAVILLFIVVGAITLYAIFRSRSRSGDRPPQVFGNRRLEIGWTVALVLGLAVLLVHPVAAELYFDRVPDPQNALNVRVVGHQWWWEFQYPDQHVVTANELHIPAGRVVRLELTSADVIHALGVPRLGGLNLAIPGRVTLLWFKADQPGVYQGQCRELCGASHARMLFRVVAESPADFDAWIQKMQHPDVNPTDPLAQKGKEFFTTGPCKACHTINGTAANGTFGPNLTLLGDRTSIGGGVRENTPQALAEWLHDPASLKPGTLMPNYNLTQDQINALVAFLEGMK